jgi:hypothetical protein
MISVADENMSERQMEKNAVIYESRSFKEKEIIVAENPQ